MSSKRIPSAWPVQAAATFCFLAAILLGLSALLSACAWSPDRAQRQIETNNAYSNAVVVATQSARYVPPPANYLIETLGAIALAGLGVWNSYLHRQVVQVRNGNGHGNPGSPGLPAPAPGPFAGGLPSALPSGPAPLPPGPPPR